MRYHFRTLSTRLRFSICRSRAIPGNLLTRRFHSFPEQVPRCFSFGLAHEYLYLRVRATLKRSSKQISWLDWVFSTSKHNKGISNLCSNILWNIYSIWKVAQGRWAHTRKTCGPQQKKYQTKLSEVITVRIFHSHRQGLLTKFTRAERRFTQNQK